MKMLPIVVIAASLAIPSLAQDCPCDCNSDRAVRVNELATGVNITLERVGMDRCPPADSDGSNSVEVNDLIAGVGAALGGCPALPEPTPTTVPRLSAEDLAAARALWQGQGLGHYQYRYGLGCFCPGPHDVVIEVFDERIVEFRDPATGNSLDVAYDDLYLTVNGLFDLLESELERAETIRADFDPTLGFPTQVFIDGQSEVADDELWVTIADVEPLQIAGVCRTANDCDVSFEICVEPGGFAGCGVCFDHQAECASDGECGDDICEPVGYNNAQHCACDPSVLVCKPGCDADTDCPTGQTCDENRHCVAAPCRPPDRPWSDDSCPPLFTCNATVPSSGTCHRTMCQSDTDCGERVGVCVNGQCYDGPGRCDVVPP